MIRFALSAWSILPAIAIALSVAPGSTHADVRLGGQVAGTFNTHSMKDWNDLSGRQDPSLGLRDIQNGFSFGAGPVLILDDRWLFGVHYERLIAQKAGRERPRIEPSANSFGASCAYLIPSNSRFRLGLGGALDFVSLAGEVQDEFLSETKGSGVGFQVLGLGRFSMNPALSGLVSVGYRRADIHIDELGGVDLSSIGLDTEDYSGLVARLGIELHQRGR